MSKSFFITLVLLIVFVNTKAQLQLSPVNTGDCVAPRIETKRTAFADELAKKRCTENNPDKAKARRCIENSKSESEFAFFTDRCSESDFYIGINGKEYRLKRISKKPGKPNNFIGAFAGNGVTVNINHPRLINKTYLPGEPKNESYVEDAFYKVDVTVTRGNVTKAFKDVSFWYGM